MPLHIIQDIGSYAGFAAIVGLAVLSALYFSQARDVKRLREWAGRAPERADTPTPVPGRVTAQPQQPRPAAPPVPGAQPAAAAATGAGPATAMGPAAATPAGQAAGAPANGAVEDEETEFDEDAAAATANGDTGEDAAIVEPTEAAEGEPEDVDEDEREDAAEDTDDEREPVKAGATAAAAGAVAASAAGRKGESEAGAATPAAQAGAESPGDGEAPPVPWGQGAATPAGQGEAGAQGSAAAPVAPARPGGGGEVTDAPATGSRPAALGSGPSGGASPGSAPSGGAAPGTSPPTGAPFTRGGLTGAPGRPAARAGSPPVPGRGGRPPGRVASPAQTAIIPPPSRPPWYRRLLASPRYLVLAIAGVLIVGGGAAFGVTQLTKSHSGGSSGSPSQKASPDSSGSSGGSGKPSGGSSTAIDPKKVTVSVLNGTTVPGLAAQLGDKIQGFGFQLGNVTNSTDQQRAESAVLYAPGHAREAAAVARRLRIGQRERIDSQTQGLAGDASVVVIAGLDLTR